MASFESPYDIELDNGNIGLMISSPPTTGPKFRRTYQGIAEPKYMRYSNWNKGMGHDDYHVDGGYGWGEGVSTRHRGVAIGAGFVTQPITLPYGIGGSGVWGGSFTYDNDLYLVGGENVYKLAGGELPITRPYGAGTNSQFANPVTFGQGTQAGVYIGVYNLLAGGTQSGFVRFDGTNWTSSGGTPGDGTHCGFGNLATVYWDTNGAQGQRLIALDTYSSFVTLTAGTADPLDLKNWSSSIKVGDQFTYIRSIAATAHHAYFCKQSGVYDIDARLYTPNITPYFMSHYDFDNGAINHIMDGYLYVSYARGLTRVPLNGLLQQGPEPCHPMASMSSRSPIFGPVTAITDYQGWLVVAVYNPVLNKSYICWGKDKERTGNPDAVGPLEWHGAEAVVDGVVEHLRVHVPNVTPSTPSYGIPRLWILGNNGGVGYVRYQYLHQSESYYQDYIQGVGTPIQNYWELNLADGLPEARTLFRVPWEYETETQNLSSTDRLYIKVSADGAAHTLEATHYTSPRDRTPAGANIESCTRLDVRVVMDQSQANSPQNYTTEPGVFRGLSIPCSVHGQKFEVRQYPVGLAKGQRLRNGAPDTQDPSQVTSDLLALHSETANLVTMRDETGEYIVEVLSSDDTDAQERHGEYEQSIDLGVRIINIVERYDNGRHYDDDVHYG